jgi:protein-L-isoaspartate(D-aspartate) O-methyltransferase
MLLKKMIPVFCLFFHPGGDLPDDFKDKREEMVKSQLIARGISDKKVLEAFRKVPRDLFVPPEYQRYAYADQPLPIGHDQTISQPYIVAYMTEILDIQPGDKVLEIGTGSGYQAAILAELGAEVFSIEIVKPLSIRAQTTLQQSGYSNIHLKTGDGYHGWPEFAPFHAILVTCSPSGIPNPLIQQLAEGGKMIIPVGKEGIIQYLYLLEKENNKIRQKKVMAVRFVPMVNEKRTSY